MSRAIELEVNDAVVNEIQDFTEQLAALENGTLHEESWQKRRIWQGIYGQRQAGVQMIRIKIPYGVGTTKQFKAVADLSTQMTNSIVHITTRAALQLHYIPRAKTPELLKGVADAGLTSREACGNVVRNITADPFAAITPDQVFNVLPLAEALFVHCLRNPYAQNFPRKFKISFSGNEEKDGGLSFMHDIGYIATEVDGEYRLNVYAAGGLGGRPIGADLIQGNMPLEDILISTTALMRIFNEYGNRKNRNKARMKFIKDSWGLDKFIEEYNAEFNRIKESEYGQSLIMDVDALDLDLPKEAADLAKLDDLIADKEWLKQSVFAQNTVDTYGVKILVRLGDITAEDMHAVCDIADEFGNGEIRSTVTQDLIIPNIKLADVAKVYDRLKAIGYANYDFDKVNNVVACPGRSTCNLSVTSSKGLGDSLVKSFDADPELLTGVEDANINISGCHNGCGQHAIAGIGFNGSSRVVDGKAVPCANISIGGGASNGIRKIARRVGRVAAKKAPEALQAILAYYRENAPEGQNISTYLQEVDVKEIKAIIKPFDQIDAEDASLFLDYEMKDGEEYSPAVGMGECAGGVLNLVTEALDDSKNFINMAKEVFAKGFYNDVYFNLREAVKHTLQGALIEAGESAKEFGEYWELYTKFFAANANLPARPEVQAETQELDKAAAEALLAEVSDYCGTIYKLYLADKENLKPVQDGEVETNLDLTGIACPMNYVKAKMALEKLADGDQLEMLIDTGAAFRTVPASLQEDGHKIVELAPVNDDSAYKLIVVKNGK